MFCDEVRSLVEELQQGFPGVEVKFLDAYREENELVIARELSGEDHGALARGAGGKTIWTAPGHRLTREKLREGFTALTQGH